MPSSSTTTSWPSSTSRLARSMASSATIVWSLAGRSKVEEMTSPLTERSKSVTSSGRSSTSTTIRWHSGLFVVIEFAIDCMIIVLPALDGRDDQAALALADRGGDVDDAADQVGRARSRGAAARRGRAGSASGTRPGPWRPRGRRR